MPQATLACSSAERECLELQNLAGDRCDPIVKGMVHAAMRCCCCMHTLAEMLQMCCCFEIRLVVQEDA
jgi:hypothetical protein